MIMSTNRYLVVNDATGKVVNVIVGSVEIPGFSLVLKTPDNNHVGFGWTLVDGEFVDTRPHRGRSEA